MKKEVLQSCPPVIRDFLTYSEAIKGKSSRSVEGYYLDLITFFRYILSVRGLAPKDTDFEKIDISSVDIALIKTITLADLYAFLVFCKNERDNNTATRARKTSTLRIFFKYLSSNTHQIEENPALMLEAPKVKQSLPKHLTLEDSLELLNAVDGNNKQRDYCILTLFLNCGLRLAELCSLNITDISNENTLTVTGKGNKERLIYLNNACQLVLKDYRHKSAYQDRLSCNRDTSPAYEI